MLGRRWIGRPCRRPATAAATAPCFPDSDGIKNSKQAVVFTSYDEQAKADAPPPEPRHRHGRLGGVVSDEQGDAPALKLDPGLMASAEGPSVSLGESSIMSGPIPPPRPGDLFSRFPWKRGIVTTTFWIGETATHNNPVPNHSSCWDPHWALDYGGNDPSEASERTGEYIPASFTPGLNPFYVALPYNDMEHGAHKAEAAQVIPWFTKEYQGPTKSVCQGRWIAIRFGTRVCYAQWEDAGPFRTDHWEYVFGNERPLPNLNHGAGLDVSPAVRDYLGMNSTDVTDWKFVDFDEVPHGPWAKYGENNTFVQNSRKAQSAVVELNPAPSILRVH